MKFCKGQSGNPRGRPPKTDHARSAQLRRRILASAPEIIDGLIQAAKAGDVAAARAVLACCVPPLKPVEMPAALPAALIEHQPPKSAPEPPRTVIELEAHETMNDAAAALGITPDELHRQIDAGQIVIKPAEEFQP